MRGDLGTVMGVRRRACRSARGPFFGQIGVAGNVSSRVRGRSSSPIPHTICVHLRRQAKQHSPSTTVSSAREPVQILFFDKNNLIRIRGYSRRGFPLGEVFRLYTCYLIPLHSRSPTPARRRPPPGPSTFVEPRRALRSISAFRDGSSMSCTSRSTLRPRGRATPGT